MQSFFNVAQCRFNVFSVVSTWPQRQFRLYAETHLASEKKRFISFILISEKIFFLQYINYLTTNKSLK